VNRIVLDTNIVVSAFLWGGMSRLVITRAIEMGTSLLVSEGTLQELERTLNKPKFEGQFGIIGKTPAQIVHEYAELTTKTVPAPIPAGLVRDVKDDIILAVAVGGKATHLISGDKDLIILGEYEGIRILTPAQYLQILETPPPSESSSQLPPE